MWLYIYLIRWSCRWLTKRTHFRWLRRRTVGQGAGDAAPAAGYAPPAAGDGPAAEEGLAPVGGSGVDGGDAAGDEAGDAADTATPTRCSSVASTGGDRSDAATPRSKARRSVGWSIGKDRALDEEGPPGDGGGRGGKGARPVRDALSWTRGSIER